MTVSTAIPASSAQAGPGTRPPSAPEAATGVLVSVIIVSYNTRALTLRCLATLATALGDTPAEIIVVDNDSRDGSADAIAAGFPTVRLIRSGRNGGFGAANNLGFTASRGRYLLLLNSDAFCIGPALPRLLEAAERHPRAGVVGPRLLNEDSSLQLSCFRFPTPAPCWLENLWISPAFSPASSLGDYRNWPHDREQEVDWLVGACMLVRREAISAAGAFDEGFFMYAEETDWQRRIRDAGWSVVFTPSAEVTHLGGSSGKSEAVKIRGSFFDSLDRYVRKHHGLVGLVSMRLAMAVGSTLRAGLWSGVWLLRRGKDAIATSKVKLHLWLIKRQLTTWTTASKPVPAVPNLWETRS